MKPTRIMGLTLVFLFSFLLTHAQGISKEKLAVDILHMDSVLFNAFNQRDIGTIQIVLAKNCEFYHDKDGFSDYTKTISSFKKMFAQPFSIERQLVPGSFDVYPLPGYGAVEFGTHKFIRTENGMTLEALYKFVHTWQYANGKWMVTRVVSVGH